MLEMANSEWMTSRRLSIYVGTECIPLTGSRPRCSVEQH